MELLFIVSVGTAMALAVWAVLLPFPEFRFASRTVLSLLAAAWEGWFRLFARLALSDSIGAGRLGRLRPAQRQVSQVRRFLLAACTRADAGAEARRSGRPGLAA